MMCSTNLWSHSHAPFPTLLASNIEKLAIGLGDEAMPLNFMHLVHRLMVGGGGWVAGEGEGGCIWFIDWEPGAYLVYQWGGGGIMGRYTTISYQNKNLVNVKSTQSNECIFVLSLDNSGIDSSAITHSL